MIKLSVDWEEIKKEYLDDTSLSYAAIAKKLKCSESAVSSNLRKRGVLSRANSTYLSIDVNHDFFETIDTEEKAYWLGFFCADGNISKNYISFSQSSKDLETVLKFKTSVGSNHKVSFYDCEIRPGDLGNMSSIRFSSQKMVSDLNRLGITENKTKIVDFPKIDSKLDCHFIRGYFDGNGSVYTYFETKINKLVKLSIIECSFNGNIKILKGIQTRLNLPDSVLKTDKRGYHGAAIICFKRKSRCLSFYNYLYSDATIFLDRKRNIFKKYFNI